MTGFENIKKINKGQVLRMYRQRIENVRTVCTSTEFFFYGRILRIINNELTTNIMFARRNNIGRRCR